MAYEYYKDGKVITTYFRKDRKGLEPLDWRDELKEFDVLISPGGNLRVIREAKYDLFGRLFSVTVFTKKCNRFNGAFRLFCRWELKSYKKAQLRYRPTKDDYLVRNHLLTPYQYQNRNEYSCWSAKSFI